MTGYVSTKAHTSDDPVVKYINDHSVAHRIHPVQAKLIEVTRKHEFSRMLGSADELLLLSNLVKYLGYKKTLDIGVFTGYSALSIALALPEDGKVIACDTSDEFTSIGKPFWKEAGVDAKIELIIAPALDTLKNLVEKGEAGTFDFAFIDADKENYGNYYEMCLTLLRPGGLIALDNVLWSGKVATPSHTDESTVAIRNVNTKIAKDDRVDMSLIAIGDGTTLAFKR